MSKSEETEKIKRKIWRKKKKKTNKRIENKVLKFPSRRRNVTWCFYGHRSLCIASSSFFPFFFSYNLFTSFLALSSVYLLHLICLSRLDSHTSELSLYGHSIRTHTNRSQIEHKRNCSTNTLTRASIYKFIY